jgi:hypothetical protein
MHAGFANIERGTTFADADTGDTLFADIYSDAWGNPN